MSHITYVVLKRCWIGEVDDWTALKYPHERGVEVDRFKTAQRDLYNLVTDNPIIALQQGPRNLLLDKNLGFKLADFQGKHLSVDGEVLLTCFSEPRKFSRPRYLPAYADIKTDLFALGSIIYFIMMGHDVYPDPNNQDKGSDEEVQRRFRTRQFPQESYVCSVITAKGWGKEHNSAIETAQDIEAIEKGGMCEEMV